MHCTIWCTRELPEWLIPCSIGEARKLKVREAAISRVHLYLRFHQLPRWRNQPLPVAPPSLALDTYPVGCTLPDLLARKTTNSKVSPRPSTTHLGTCFSA